MEFIIEKDFDGRTVKDWLYQNGVSRGMITRLKKLDDGLLVNGERVTVRRVLHAGDRFIVAVEDTLDDGNGLLIPTDMPIDIIYEDQDIIAVNKPCGMPTHPTRGHFTDTLANALAYYFSSLGKPFVFRAVNRLDRDTTGIVLVAKNRLASSAYSALMQDGKIRKSYIAILNGVPADSGVIDAPIRRKSDSTMLREVCGENAEGSKSAVTRYKVLACDRYRRISVVLAEPVTGRTHQLRVHFAHIGCPLVGDGLYGTAETTPSAADGLMSRHALHAARMRVDAEGFVRELSAPLPEDMRRLVGLTEYASSEELRRILDARQI